MRYILAIVALFLLPSCAVKLPKEAYAIREIMLDRARFQFEESAGLTKDFIIAMVADSLEENIADLELAHEGNMMQASTPAQGAVYMANFLMGVEQTIRNETDKLEELMQIVEGLYIAQFGYEKVIESQKRELGLSDEAWDQFVKTEAARLAKQAIEEGIQELVRREEQKKLAAIEKAKEKSENEKMREEIEALKAALEHKAKEEAKKEEPATPDTVEQPVVTDNGEEQ